MDSIFPGVFSEYAVKEVAFKVDGADAYTVVDGAGTLNDEFEMRTVTKSKSNIVKKQITGYTGNGTLNISAHMPYDLKNDIYGDTSEELQTGVYGLNTSVKPPKVEIAAIVEDEDGDLGYVYYPQAVIASRAREIESNGDEVAETEMEFALSADEYGYPTYTALAEDLTGTTITTDNWLTDVSSDLLQADEA